MEHERDGPIDELNVNAAEVISDLCKFLGLSEQNRRKVLGMKGAQHMAALEIATTTVSIGQ